jgi:site-specific DNA-cytosine methylase
VNILVACEESGVVREAFRRRGHEAWSCDLLPAADGSPHHYQCDVAEVLDDAWDMIIAFPPCTDLCVSGARWFKAKRESGEQQRSIEFFMRFANNPCPRVAIENPIGIMSSVYRKPDQIIQPWQFGHGETKATCLWLKGLPLLKPTNIVSGREARVHRMPPGPERSKLRSRTYTGVAEAMADQWGNL